MSALRRPPDRPAPAVVEAVPRRGRPPQREGIARSGRLAGLEAHDLAARFGTPAYLYDVDLIERRYAALRGALPSRVDIAYAVKANPALAIVDFLGRQGAGADVASSGELATALRAGIDPSRIVMTGPGKRDAELQAAVAAGVRAVTVESPNELARLESLAAARGEGAPPVPVLLRMAVGERARLERVRLVGDDGAGKFGMDAPDLVASSHRAATSPHLRLLGLHAFGASNVLDADALVAHAHETVRAARALASAVGVPLRLVDLGGGLGIPYEVHEDPLDLQRLGHGLAALIDGWAGDPSMAEARLLVEPGRWLVGPAGAYLSRVVDRKTVGGEHVVILDGGVHHLLRPALVGTDHVLRAFPGRPDGPAIRAADRTFPVTVAGPLCSGLDVFAQHAVLAAPDVGDLVAVLDVGAYGFTESMPLFLSHAIPPEVAIRRGRAELIRPRQEPADWLERQRVPAW